MWVFLSTILKKYWIESKEQLWKYYDLELIPPRIYTRHISSVITPNPYAWRLARPDFSFPTFIIGHIYHRLADNAIEANRHDRKREKNGKMSLFPNYAE